MIPAENTKSSKDNPFCISCRLNRTIPDLTVPQNHDLWARMETAKRRLVYSLLNLKLPIANKTEDPKQGLAFDFLSDVMKPDGSVSNILTGHDNGLITLNLSEADDATREKNRHAMNEPYRTLLGHFRHEIGHYYWDRLVRGTKFLEPFRALFGNEQADYYTALITGLQVLTNNKAATGTGYRTEGQFIRVQVGTTVTNVVISYTLPPIASNDFYYVSENTALVVAAPGVLGNDISGASGGTLTPILVTSPSHGTLVTGSTNGSFTYMPATNFTGTDSIHVSRSPTARRHHKSRRSPSR